MDQTESGIADYARENPLAHSDLREQRIRERAYLLWEADGQPHGRDAEYWERAQELEGMAESPGAGLVGVDRPEVVDEASLQANLGEFPDRSADQGDHLAAPMTRAQERAVRKTA